MANKNYYRHYKENEEEKKTIASLTSASLNKAANFFDKRRELHIPFEKSLDKIEEGYEDNIISMKNVTISYKRGMNERVVVDNFSLDIKRGEIFGLVGESGSGKTTVGRTIMRMIPIKSGEIRYNGHLISGKIPYLKARELKTKIQMIFQDPGASLNERANVDYIISEGIRAFHMYKDEEERLQKVEKIIDDVGLRPEHLRRYPHEFSGGQRQRIGIARCMIMNPKLVVADEPISALDVSIRAQVLNLIKKFQMENEMTVLFIAHDLSVVKYISDRIGVIYDGRLVELASANRLFEKPLHPYTKSLLSAVPIPDPNEEKKKKIIVYNPMMHGYRYDDLPQFYEVEPGHFVRANKKELEVYKEQVKEVTKSPKKVEEAKEEKPSETAKTTKKTAKPSQKGTKTTTKPKSIATKGGKK